MLAVFEAEVEDVAVVDIIWLSEPSLVQLAF